MKKRILTLLFVAATLVSCESLQQGLMSTYNMVNCEYNYRSISGLSIGGVNMSNGLSLAAIPKVTSILTGSAKSIPLDFTLNLDVKNPNQSNALLHGLQYIISIDGVQFTTGSLNQSLNIAAGQTQTLPLTIGVDLASLMKNESKDAVVDIAKNFLGIGSKKSQVSLQLKPSFKVDNTMVASPIYIPVNFSFGGNK
ncbi:LEA type 2 family protein [Dysgonomonas sp. Marseille-P4361]|uniref:LEA type 2 family protein n=1 Tax=Dysgonomonas sp. Marseille-P4361 TaxID=2161820 RepID=UPI000D54FFF0|nr:LEA type 2 family protein [Dysgonomonas sp. Marseille-P4361]